MDHYSDAKTQRNLLYSRSESFFRFLLKSFDDDGTLKGDLSQVRPWFSTLTRTDGPGPYPDLNESESPTPAVKAVSGKRSSRHGPLWTFPHDGDVSLFLPKFRAEVAICRLWNPCNKEKRLGVNWGFAFLLL